MHTVKAPRMSCSPAPPSDVARKGDEEGRASQKLSQGGYGENCWQETFPNVGLWSPQRTSRPKTEVFTVPARLVFTTAEDWKLCIPWMGASVCWFYCGWSACPSSTIVCRGGEREGYRKRVFLTQKSLDHEEPHPDLMAKTVSPRDPGFWAWGEDWKRLRVVSFGGGRLVTYDSDECIWQWQMMDITAEHRRTQALESDRTRMVALLALPFTNCAWPWTTSLTSPSTSSLFCKIGIIRVDRLVIRVMWEMCAKFLLARDWCTVISIQ